MNQHAILGYLRKIVACAKARTDAITLNYEHASAGYSQEIESITLRLVEEVSKDDPPEVRERVESILISLVRQSVDLDKDPDRLLGLYPVFALVCGDRDTAESSNLASWVTKIDWSPMKEIDRVAA